VSKLRLAVTTLLLSSQTALACQSISLQSAAAELAAALNAERNDTAAVTLLEYPPQFAIPLLRGMARPSTSKYVLERLAIMDSVARGEVCRDTLQSTDTLPANGPSLSDNQPR
jgi:hypothetical protein